MSERCKDCPIQQRCKEQLFLVGTVPEMAYAGAEFAGDLAWQEIKSELCDGPVIAEGRDIKIGPIRLKAPASKECGLDRTNP